MKTKFKKSIILGALAFLVVFPVSAVSQDVTLFAGQDIPVGVVSVENDGDSIMVTYKTNGEWVLTETHLSLSTSTETIPQTKNGSPKVGNFTYSSEHDPGVLEYTYNIALEDIGVNPGNTVIVAAHAVVLSVEANIIEAPFYGSFVVEANQGNLKNGGDVLEIRSDPANALEYELGNDASNFYALGFGGDIIIGFDYPIVNGDGDDIRVIEDTWSTSYPSETADVFASQNGVDWVYLGEADNSTSIGIHTVSYFDLGILDWAKYIKVLDTTDPNNHDATSDGYDLNAVEALHDYVDIIEYGEEEESAWGFGERFVEKGNWATYFEYVIE